MSWTVAVNLHSQKHVVSVSSKREHSFMLGYHPGGMLCAMTPIDVHSILATSMDAADGMPK